jgi:transposase InsO family protein
MRYLSLLEILELHEAVISETGGARGIEYCAYKYHDTLNRYGILPSVNRLGCCQDNAHMESFFHTLKGELIRNRNIKNGKILKNLVKGYITHFYNKKGRREKS